MEAMHLFPEHHGVYLAAMLGVDHVLGTELATDVSGTRYTGALAGPNCRAAEKVSAFTRLR